MVNTRIIIYFFIIICTFINCSDYNNPLYKKCEKWNPNDKYDCFDRISEDEKNDGYQCCYQKIKKTYGRGTSYQCYLLDKEEYDDIDGFVKHLLEIYEDDYVSVKFECENQSNVQIYKYIYLIFTLLNLII